MTSQKIRLFCVCQVTILLSVFFIGVDRVNMTVYIKPDAIPELDETFTVELVNVSERNERLRTGAVS